MKKGGQLKRKVVKKRKVEDLETLRKMLLEEMMRLDPEDVGKSAGVIKALEAKLAREREGSAEETKSTAGEGKGEGENELKK
jgi:hypothetical protein